MKKFLFVCLGNICRSPTAEAVFQHKATQAGLDWSFDSAGTIGHHTGESSDPRSIEHAKKRGYEMTHKARQLQIQDFDHFDLILVMDRKNFDDVIRIAPAKHRHKVQLLRDYRTHLDAEIVPDPYYGSAADFEHVIDLIEDSWTAFYGRLTAK